MELKYIGEFPYIKSISETKELKTLLKYVVSTENDQDAYLTCSKITKQVQYITEEYSILLTDKILQVTSAAKGKIILKETPQYTEDMFFQYQLTNSTESLDYKDIQLAKDTYNSAYVEGNVNVQSVW